MEIERRGYVVDGLKVEARAKGENRKIVGHASVFNTEADIGGWFLESVAPGAFRRAIVEDDVRALFNHDANFVLGRNRAGTLRLSEDEVGLVIEVDPPDTQAARDIMVSIERGDVSQMSIGFQVLKQEWDETGDVLKRRILEARLFDVSPVTFPAFPTTDVALRSLEEFRKAHAPKGLTTRSAGAIVRRSKLQRLREKGL
jgi:HK97 family phage prohead protease